MTPHNIVITKTLNKNDNKIPELETDNTSNKLSNKTEILDSTFNMSNSVFSFENKYDLKKHDISKNEIDYNLDILSEISKNDGVNKAHNLSSLYIANIKKMDSGSNRSQIENLTCDNSKILEE